MSDNFRVALIAIASNEAAYLAQFVYHHLRLGFAPIILITNNSEDDTAAMAARMAKNLSNVIHIDGDPLLKETQFVDFQNKAYQLGLNYLEDFAPRPNYAMFLDIDEFWVPLTEDTSVSEYISRYEAPDSMMFNWVVPTQDNVVFSQPFCKNFEGVPRKLLKTIWRFGVTLEGFNAHNVRSKELVREVIASGYALERRAITAEVPSHPGSAMVVHQMYRSMLEYVAVLGRGNPDDDFIFKINRQGYRSQVINTRISKIPLGLDLCDHWRTKFSVWLDFVGIREMIIRGRFNVVKRAEQTLLKYETLSEEERETYSKPFSFVDFTSVRIEIKELLANPHGRITQLP